MRKISKSLTGAALGFTALFSGVPQSASAKEHTIDHVLLISIDGMHAVDLSTYVTDHPNSALATLSRNGVTYTSALTTAPSDSFPGILAQVTGGTPKSADVFYDVSYDRTMFAPGSACAGDPGTQTVFDESIDKDSTVVTGGGTLGQPLTQIDPSKLPLARSGGQCQPVYPHDFIKTNTIFEVIRAAGMRTAWADKHPAYDILNGPSGQGVEDLFTPEVDSNDAVTGQDTTTGFHSIQRNDRLKVEAVLNEIEGKRSTGVGNPGVPAIFGMNFQAVSVGQKLATGNPNDPQDAGLAGGYVDALGKQPNSGLKVNLRFVDEQLEQMLRHLGHANLLDSTLIIISAKHGQSPIDVRQRKAVDDGPYSKMPGYSASITDDVGLVWMKPQLQKQDYAAAKAYLEQNAGILGIAKLLTRDQLAQLYRDPFSDSRTPDFIAVTTHGLIYTSGTKLAEHGGFSHDDRNVALLVSNPGIDGATVDDMVTTTQIAPTILSALGLNPQKLEAVKMEHTGELPGLRLHGNN